jgi:hypothetical protein
MDSETEGGGHDVMVLHLRLLAWKYFWEVDNNQTLFRCEAREKSQGWREGIFSKI